MGNLTRSLKALEALVQTSTAGRSDEVDAALARFLVVRTCGYVERVVDECCKAYLKSKSDIRSASFGSTWLGRGRNPTPEGLISLTGKFDGTWAEELEGLLKEQDELLSRELAFLVDRRNRIAHGLSEGVGVRKALDLVPVAEKIAHWFIARFDPR